MSDPIQTQAWLDAFVDSAEEVADGFLGQPGMLIERKLGSCAADSGAYISIAGKQSARHIGLVCDEEGSRQIAELLLCCADDDDEELSEEDIADAFGEVINIIAGGIKTRLESLDPSLELGLPMIIKGNAFSPVRCQSGEATFNVGEIGTKLVILGASN